MNRTSASAGKGGVYSPIKSVTICLAENRGGIKRLRKLVFLSQVSEAHGVRMQIGRWTFCPSFSLSEPPTWGPLGVAGGGRLSECAPVSGRPFKWPVHTVSLRLATIGASRRAEGPEGQEMITPILLPQQMREASGRKILWAAVSLGSLSPLRPLTCPLGHLSSGLGLCQSRLPVGRRGRGYVACVPLPPRHPAAWFKGSAMQFRPHPSHSGRSTASADDLASALPGPPAFPPVPRGGSVSRPHTRTRGVRGSASRRGSWQRAGFRWNPS